MPLRDHFRPPLASRKSWEGLHGQWPSKIVDQLNASLPPEYEAEPRVQLGSAFEIDVSTYERDNGGTWNVVTNGGAGNDSAAPWSPGEPALLLESKTLPPSEYEVLVYDVTLGRRLVAAVEIVSPAKKDRSENRRSFIYKLKSEKQVSIKPVKPVLLADPPHLLTFDIYPRSKSRKYGLFRPKTGCRPIIVFTLSINVKRSCATVCVLQSWTLLRFERPTSQLIVGEPQPGLRQVV